MGADYIPEKDYFAEVWLRHFANRVSSDVVGYRVLPADAEEAVALAEAFRVALRATQTPGVQSSSLIRTKNNARKSAEAVMRPMAQWIKRDQKIPESLKVQVGLSAPAKRRHSVPTPASTPSLYVNSLFHGMMTIFVWDSETQKRRRPADVTGLELYERVRPLAVVEAARARTFADKDEAEEVVVDVQAAVEYRWRFVGVHTAWPIELFPGVERAGDEVSYVARWMTRQGKTGPFGDARTVRANYNSAIHLAAPQRLYPAA